MSHAGTVATLLAVLCFAMLMLAVQWSAAPRADALQPGSVAPAVDATETPMPTPSPTPGTLSVAIYVTPSLPIAVPGSLMAVTVTKLVGPGCQFPTYELTLKQSNPLFDYVDPPDGIMRPGDSGPVFIVRAAQPGVTIFEGQVYGEVNCSNFWTWHYESGFSDPVTVTVPAPRQYLPAVGKHTAK